MANTETTEIPVDRREKQDRRKANTPVAVERRKVQRRRQIDPTTCERDYTNDEIEFMQALDEYKRNNGRMFPTCSEILEVIRDLGYCRRDEDESSADEGFVADSITNDEVGAPPTDTELLDADESAAF